MDEDSGTLDGERILNRISAIPFKDCDDMNASDFSEKQLKFKKIVDNPAKPTELLIGEMGDFLRSEEFSKTRFHFANMHYEKTDESIKMRAIMTNYSSLYAILEQLSSIFAPAWEEYGHSWDGFMDWVEKQHQEKDHFKHSIGRYFYELLIFTVEDLWDLQIEEWSKV